MNLIEKQQTKIINKNVKKNTIQVIIRCERRSIHYKWINKTEI